MTDADAIQHRISMMFGYSKVLPSGAFLTLRFRQADTGIGPVQMREDLDGPRGRSTVADHMEPEELAATDARVRLFCIERAFFAYNSGRRA